MTGDARLTTRYVQPRGGIFSVSRHSDAKEFATAPAMGRAQWRDGIVGAQKPEFFPTRRLTVQEAAQLADEVLARASTALRCGPPPVRPCRAMVQGRALGQALPTILVARSAVAMGPFAECILIGCAALACVIGWLVQQAG